MTKLNLLVKSYWLYRYYYIDGAYDELVGDLSLYSKSAINDLKIFNNTDSRKFLYRNDMRYKFGHSSDYFKQKDVNSVIVHSILCRFKPKTHSTKISDIQRYIYNLTD